MGTIKFTSWDGRSFPRWISYAKGQREQGAGGFEHWQLVVQCDRPTRLSKLKTWIRDGHWEPTRSDAALEYVWKEDTRVPESQFEHGTRRLRRNDAKDWDQIKQDAKEGNLDRIPADVYVRHYGTLKRIALDNLKPVAIERECQLYVGPTGTGKSRRAWNEAGMEAYIKNPNTKWWDGYKGEDHVIIDEFRGRIDASYLLTWTDRYPVQVETKGGALALMASKFWICSNIGIREWYPELGEETILALERRIKVIQF